MKKRILAVLMAAVLLLGSGCAMFETEYFSVSDYEGEEDIESGEHSGSVKNYSELRRAISAMVERHDESGKLSFNGYDGSVSDDLASACWEVRTETVLGAYTVDYMSYDLNRIVTYYEADIFITYRRSKEEADAVIALNGTGDLQTLLLENMRSASSRFAVRTSAQSLTPDGIVALAHRLYLDNPLILLEEPEVTVSVYPQDSLSRIFEIDLHYENSAESLEQEKQDLRDAVMQTAGKAVGNGTADAVQLAESLREECRYRSLEDECRASHALLEGIGGSGDLALAYLTLCQARGITAVVVEGRLEQETHYWNIVTIGGESYHIDVSSLYDDSPVLLASDEEMGTRYWWDPEGYPVCEGSLQA